MEQANSAANNATTIVRAQYIRDLSFENPNPLAIFTSESQDQPEISVGIQAKAQNLGDRNFELILDFNIDAKRAQDTMFIVELSYGAVVTVSEDVAESDVQRSVMVDAAHLLFPFARNIIADMTRDGGYPPLMLAPIDFNNLYQQQNQQPAAGLN
ncbi:protein-export chaperone SecB [Candidatus Odyssella thessalonicensis]|uniref:protein-export chaperone SecB n=1 Tax=Candidatus Odyssella thessalonicensis TaxID=84647 RepID=UPI000225C1E6|nr:protein-export chaperone SecB [Candidatus Odyssella thessalonicensis]